MRTTHTCSGDYAALKAGEENPRCQYCDTMLEQWSNGEPIICEACSSDEPAAELE